MVSKDNSVEESFSNLAASFSELAALLVSMCREATDSCEEVDNCELEKETGTDVPSTVIDSEEVSDTDEGVVFAADLEVDEETLQNIADAATTLGTYADLYWNTPMPSDPVAASVFLTALENTALPRWKYPHIHISKDSVVHAICLDSAHASAGLPAAAEYLTKTAGRTDLSRTPIEEDLIADGILSSLDYLLSEEDLLRALGLDYTIKLLPGVCDILKLIDSDDEGNMSVISAIAVLNKAAEYMWNVPSTQCGMRMLIAAFNIAAAVKEAELAKLISSKFSEEIKSGVEFVTLPQAEVITGKSVTEIARMLNDSTGSSALRLVECQRGGNLFVIDKSMLFSNNSDNIRD